MAALDDQAAHLTVVVIVYEGSVCIVAVADKADAAWGPHGDKSI